MAAIILVAMGWIFIDHRLKKDNHGIIIETQY
jgi:hypothetical protein